MNRVLAALLLMAAGRAAAWNVQSADVDARIKELDAAWNGKDEGAVELDILRRAKQAAPPDWLGKAGWDAQALSKGVKPGKDAGGWTVAVESRPAAFGVGAVAKPTDRRAAMKEAETKAKRWIGKKTSSGKGADGQARALDWYISDRGDVFVLDFGTAAP